MVISEVIVRGRKIFTSTINNRYSSLFNHPPPQHNFQIFNAPELTLRFAPFLPCGQAVSLRSAHRRHPPPPPPLGTGAQGRSTARNPARGGAKRHRRIIPLPRAPSTSRPWNPPRQAVKEWIPDDEPDLDWFKRPRNPSNSAPGNYDQHPSQQSEEILLGDGRTLVLDFT
jgi:hypothetical protein